MSNKDTINNVASGAIDAAFKYMQDRLGVTDGGFAGVFLDDERERVLRDLFGRYILEQIEHEGE